MAAKPVLDMLAVVEDIGVADVLTPELLTLGYEAAGEWGIPGRRLFRKGGEARTHHLHVYPQGNPHIARHLAVRDYLRGHANEREQYNAIKQQLAARYADTRAYRNGKHAYVDALEQRALEWAGSGDGRAGCPL